MSISTLIYAKQDSSSYDLLKKILDKKEVSYDFAPQMVKVKELFDLQKKNYTFIIIGDEFKWTEQIEICKEIKKLEYKGSFVSSPSANSSMAEVKELSTLFLHFIFDLQNEVAIEKKISNLLAIFQLKNENQRLVKLEGQLEGESEKLVEVNVNNVRLLADVKQKNILLDIAKKNIQNILDNLSQGFMTINIEGKVQEGFSKSVGEIYGCEPLGQDFFEMTRLPTNEKDKLREWVGFVFDEMLSFDDLKPLAIKGLNLKERYISLDYYPIKNNTSKIEKIIIISTDKTVEKMLEEKTKEEENFVQLILAVVKDRTGFFDFINETKKLLETLSMQLSKPLKQIDLALCFRAAHSIKGNCAAYHMDDVKSEGHKLEEYLTILRQAVSADDGQRSEQEFPIIKEYFEKMSSAFQKHLGRIEDSLKISFSKVVETKAVPKKDIISVRNCLNSLLVKLLDNGDAIRSYDDIFLHTDLAEYFENIASKIIDISTRLKKPINYNVNCQIPIKIDLDPYKSFLNSLMHAYRNAIDHGIEESAEREMKGKNLLGEIKVILAKDVKKDLALQLTIQDDGRGVDPEKIRQSLINKGLVEEKSAKDLSDQHLINCLFMSGFSTKETANEWSGRGVGLDAVKVEVDKLGGQIAISSIVDQGTKIIIDLPLFIFK
ncbi:MAG: Hpt domain-containing protein [Oligoflexia bacterium]|nr:Hpt domain-containing protein [Oligoflexia bacterium]